MSVPFVDLRRIHEPLRADCDAAMRGVIDRGAFILGEEVERFEAELAAYCGVKHAVGLDTGTSALELCLRAWGVGEGDEVITAPNSFIATASGIAFAGARPVFADIDPQTYNLDPNRIEVALTPRTKAIVPVHLFGQSAEMAPLMAAAARQGLAVVEDAAQAIGARHHGRPVGGLGHVGCFSFFPSKNLGAFGDGGLVTTNDRALAEKVRLLRGHGMQPKYYHAMIGGNFRLDALQAAVLRVKARHLAGWTEARRRNADRYRALFAGRPRLPVALPAEAPGNYHIYNQFVIRVPDRDGLRAHLTEAGVGTEIYYPVPFHLQACFADLGHRRGQFPAAEAAADGSLALPIYGELSEDQQAVVVEAIADYYAA